MPNIFDLILASQAPRICVTAVPGCGKTRRVLIPKLEQILSAPGIDGGTVLLLTFSRLSALDLKARVAGFAVVPRASTVHAYALAFLISENNHAIRDRVESIVLDFEKEALLSDLKVIFPTRNKRQLRKDLTAFSAAWATQPHDAIFEATDHERSFKNAIVRWLHEHRAAMMEEILFHAVDLARQLPTAPFIQGPRYILVDEYQDLNELEQEFIRLLAADSQLLVVVGDPDQSIYSFKYAHPQGIRDFAAEQGVDPFSHLVTGRCAKRIVYFARQLLLQNEPQRTDLLEALPNAPDGEVHFVRRRTQEEEFAYVLQSIAAGVRSGALHKDIIVLVPRRKLGSEFVTYANAHWSEQGLASPPPFAFVLKPDFSPREQECLLRFSLAVKPDSLLHRRCYVGMSDESHFAKELNEIKGHYGSLDAAFQNARSDDFGARQRKVRALCDVIQELNAMLEASSLPDQSVGEALDQLVPSSDPELSSLRSMIDALREESDTLPTLYAKLLDYMRSVPADESAIRVMTLLASKGLEAEHVYIVGCNAGNLPGENRSSSLTDLQHREEQLRLLYVAFTRAKASLTVSWAQNIPFDQSRRHRTASVRTVRINGRAYSGVGLCEFLQLLEGMTWETS
jgi:DNA helicase-2/ATP-dependent DNA helicase PcrA